MRGSFEACVRSGIAGEMYVLFGINIRCLPISIGRRVVDGVIVWGFCLKNVNDINLISILIHRLNQCIVYYSVKICGSMLQKHTNIA